MSGHSLGVMDVTRSDPLRVLEEMKRVAVELLGGLPAGLGRAVEQVLQSTGAGPSFQEQAALLVLRQHSASHVMRFRQEIARAFDDFRIAGRARENELDLVDERVIDFHLAGQRLAEMLEQRYQRPLEVMKGRLNALASALHRHNAPNPIAPSRLTSAFVATFADAELPEALSTLLFRQYQLELARVLDDLYVRVNAQLATAGYGADMQVRRAVPLPSSRPWVRPDEQITPAEVAEVTPRPVVPAVPSQPVISSRLSAELNGLRAQLRAWRAQSAVATDPDAQCRLQQRRELRVQEVTTIASVLQAESPDTYARALAMPGRLADAIRDHLAEGGRRLGLSPDQTRLGENEEDAIDMVAMLFDSLFRTHALQDRARRMYARLVMPYVKVALANDAMFVQPQHPARKLLDAITEACEDNDGSTPHDRELLERAALVSQRVVAEYNEDLAVFALAHSELEDLLVQQRRRSELQESRAAKAAFGRERLAQARAQADHLLQQRLAAQPLTQAVADFLITPWRHHVVQVALRDGTDSQRFGDAVHLALELCEADRLARAGRGRELADWLIALEPAVLGCLASSGFDESAARHGMAMLARDLAVPDAARRIHMAPPLASDEPANDDPRLSLAGGTATVPHDPGIAALIRRLQPGEWMRLVDAQGEATSVKVAWVSPLTSRLLLVNRRGLRALVAAPEELAAMVGAGRLVLGGERTPFSEAMQQFRRRLDHAVGQH